MPLKTGIPVLQGGEDVKAKKMRPQLLRLTSLELRLNAN